MTSGRMQRIFFDARIFVDKCALYILSYLKEDKVKLPSPFMWDG